MNTNDDQPRRERPDTDDKSKNPYSGGPSQKQIENAEQLLGSLKVPTFLEKRDLTEDYRAGALQPLDRSIDPVDVLFSKQPVSGEAYHVVLSREILPEIRDARITSRRLNQLYDIFGRFEPSHRGRRAEDQQNGTLMVSLFYPVE